MERRIRLQREGFAVLAILVFARIPAIATPNAMPSLSLFLSYNSVDRSAVVAVQTLLQARGITTFLDRDQLIPRLPWPVALEEGLRNVRGVAVFIGRDLGGWQKREMWFALDRQVREEKDGRPRSTRPGSNSGPTSFVGGVATPDEGSEDTRQRIELRATETLSEKVARELAPPAVRLLVMSGETECQTVEVAHEALIRNWERLRLWLNEDREFLLWRQRTQILVTQWQQHGRDEGDLLRGASLSEAEQWLATRTQDIPDEQAQYIAESTASRQRELEVEQQRHEAELQNVVWQILARQKRSQLEMVQEDLKKIDSVPDGSG